MNSFSFSSGRISSREYLFQFDWHEKLELLVHIDLSIFFCLRMRNGLRDFFRRNAVHSFENNIGPNNRLLSLV